MADRFVVGPDDSEPDLAQSGDWQFVTPRNNRVQTVTFDRLFVLPLSRNFHVFAAAASAGF